MTVSMRDLFGDDEPERDPGPVPESVVFVPIRAFAAEEEPGAAALLGTGDAALIPEDGDVMVYGDGGAGKTTLCVDLVLHLATGRPWLGIPISRPVGACLIENEGPRAMFRRKLKRKLEHWPELGEQAIPVLERPWGEFSFASEGWRREPRSSSWPTTSRS